MSLERTRLVRLCARFTGDSNAAEDLAQETLLEAWRHFDALRDQERLPQWLSGIALSSSWAVVTIGLLLPLGRSSETPGAGEALERIR